MHTDMHEGCFVRMCRCEITGEPKSLALAVFTGIPLSGTLEEATADTDESSPSSEFAHLGWLTHLHSSAEESEAMPLGIIS